MPRDEKKRSRLGLVRGLLVVLFCGWLLSLWGNRVVAALRQRDQARKEFGTECHDGIRGDLRDGFFVREGKAYLRNAQGLVSVPEALAVEYVRREGYVPATRDEVQARTCEKVDPPIHILLGLD
jgi:hypothetical protein